MKRVIVVGAGVSGLMAACLLAEGGCRVVVLEAAERIGGRILTECGDGFPVELGAEFIHGKPPEMLQLLQELGLSYYELQGEDISYAADGTLSPQSEDEGEGEDGDDAFHLLQRMSTWSDAHPAEDLSFAAYCAAEEVPQPLRSAARSYVEGFNAADAERIGVRSLAVQQRAEDSIQGDAAFHLDGGYTRLPEALRKRLERAGGALRSNAGVSRIAWSAGSVCATLTTGETIHGNAAVITLPLGVLQNGDVRFDPAPGNVLEQAQRMAMGQVCRISLAFRRRWWAEIDHPHKDLLQKLSFLLPEERNPEASFHVFWTGFPSLDPVLTAWSGGTSSKRFAGMDGREIAHAACGDLARIFGLAAELVLDELVTHHHHDWQHDPLFRGAYSWVPVGAVDASEKMSEPVEGTLFFAGEHTDVTGHWGTVHGALRSGMRAAKQLLARQ